VWTGIRHGSMAGLLQIDSGAGGHRCTSGNDAQTDAFQNFDPPLHHAHDGLMVFEPVRGHKYHATRHRGAA
jgi:hypothetical protein